MGHVYVKVNIDQSSPENKNSTNINTMTEQTKPLVAVPDRPVSFVPVKGGDVLTLGHLKLRIMEDGSNTGKLLRPQAGIVTHGLRADMRFSAAEIIIPEGTRGPPPHWHEMHDESFLVTEGVVRFHIPGKDPVDAHAGDYVVVPTRSPHTFSNIGPGTAKIFSTYSPAFYVNYFKLMSEMSEEGKPMSAEANVKAMAYYATIPVAEP